MRCLPAGMARYPVSAELSYPRTGRATTRRATACGSARVPHLFEQSQLVYASHWSIFAQQHGTRVYGMWRVGTARRRRQRVPGRRWRTMCEALGTAAIANTLGNRETIYTERRCRRYSDARLTSS